MVYISKDEKDIGVFNLNAGEKGDWQALEGADAIQLRQAIRIAKGEAAPDLVYAPVVASN